MVKNLSVKQQLLQDKKIILYIFLSLIAITFVGVVIFPDAFELTIYLLIYFIIGYLFFLSAPQWIAVITIFFLMYSVGLGLGQFYVWKENVDLHYNQYFVVLGGLICILVGYIAGNVSKISIKKPRFSLRDIRFPIQLKWIYILYITYALSTVTCLIFFIKNAELLLANLNDGRIEAASGNGILVYTFQLHIMTIPLMYEEYKKKNMNGITFIIFAFIAAIQLMVSGFRTPVATMIIVLLIMSIFEGKVSLKKALPIVTVVIIGVAIFGVIRNDQSSSLHDVIRSRLFLGMQNLNQIFRCFPEEISFQNGYAYLFNLIMLKPGPDLDFTLWLKDIMNIQYSGGGLTPTILGEFYLNFGYIGIFLGMSLLGFAFSKLDKWISNGKVGFWKAFLLLEFASCAGGGLSNIYILPLVFGAYYVVINLFRKQEEEN